MLTVKPALNVYDVINKYFKNDEDSRNFVSGIEEMMDNKADHKMNDFATKKDLAEMHFATKQDIFDLRAELKQDMSELKTEFKQDMSGLRTELKQDMSELRTEFKQDMSELRTEFKQDMSDLKVELKQDINALHSNFQKLDAGITINLANSAFRLEKSQKEQLKWLIGAMVAIISLAVTVLKLT